MVIRVVEFKKIGNIFAQKSTYPQEIGVVVSNQNLASFQSIYNVIKKCFLSKKCAPKLIFFNNKKMGRFR